MKFSRIIGKLDSALVKQAENKLSQVFLELATSYGNDHVGSGMGGDPLIFSLVYPIDHVCTLNMPTAATDGKRYYWNPKFVIKKDRIGLRIICTHEACHALYMHPQRRGSRIPKLWNIAVDFIVNGVCMDDLKARKMNAGEVFTKHLGKFKTLAEYAEMLKDPFAHMKELGPSSQPGVKLPKPDEDRDLTPEEQEELERREKVESFFFADPDLAEDMKRPEKIYEFLYKLLPKCPKCGRIGFYKLPKKDQSDGSGKDKGKDKGDKGDQPGDQGDKGDQDSKDGSGDKDCDHGKCPGCGGKHCDECGDGIDIFGFGNTLDDHMDTEESQEKLSKRMIDAVEAAKRMAGSIPAGLEDELGLLTAPKITTWDIIRSKLLKCRDGHGRNDWTRFRTRPMFCGLLVPKKKNYYTHFGCLLDTSGSMGKDDMAFGVSQLQSLDDRGECTLVCADSTIYWDQAITIRKCNMEELSKIKPVGRGGTLFSEFFTDYKKNIGDCDFLVMLTDGYLMDTDVAAMQDPGIPVYWIITSENISFNAPFGKVMELHG